MNELYELYKKLVCFLVFVCCDDVLKLFVVALSRVGIERKRRARRVVRKRKWKCDVDVDVCDCVYCVDCYC